MVEIAVKHEQTASDFFVNLYKSKANGCYTSASNSVIPSEVEESLAIFGVQPSRDVSTSLDMTSIMVC